MVADQDIDQVPRAKRSGLEDRLQNAMGLPIGHLVEGTTVAHLVYRHIPSLERPVSFDDDRIKDASTIDTTPNFPTRSTAVG